MSKKGRSLKSAKVEQLAVAKTTDTSPYVYQRDKLSIQLNIKQRYELNNKQKSFVETALDKESRMIICDGLWGSSKTFLSVYCALELLNQKKVGSIMYLRAPVEAGKGIGFIPGSAEEKINPYAEPLYEKLHEFLSEPEIKLLEKEKRIEIVPPGFIRGRSWSCKAIIIDEAANFSRGMLELILSRVGPFCKVFLIGSRHQSDIGNSAGFMEVFNSFDDKESKEHGIYTYEFNDESDIVRSGFSKFVMRKLGVLPSKNVMEEPMFINK